MSTPTSSILILKSCFWTNWSIFFSGAFVVKQFCYTFLFDSFTTYNKKYLSKNVCFPSCQTCKLEYSNLSKSFKELAPSLILHLIPALKSSLFFLGLPTGPELFFSLNGWDQHSRAWTCWPTAHSGRPWRGIPHRWCRRFTWCQSRQTLPASKIKQLVYFQCNFKAVKTVHCFLVLHQLAVCFKPICA